MSAQTNSFGTPVAPPEPGAAAADQDGARPGTRRNAVIAAVVVLALLLGGGAYFLLFSGSQDEGLGLPPAGTTPRAASPTTAPTTAPAISQYKGKKSRNPFVPLVVVPAVATSAASSSATSGASSGSSGTTGGTTGTTPGGTTAGGTTGSQGSTGTSPTSKPVPTPAKAMTVSVTSVDYAKRSAKIKVDRTTYDRDIGETFGTYFKLVGVMQGDECAYVQFGDVALPMCKGSPVTLH